jgi:hypothetical protein
MSKESFWSSFDLYVSLPELYTCHRALHVSRLYAGSFSCIGVPIGTIFLLFSFIYGCVNKEFQLSIHCGVEVTELSTNKQHTLSILHDR